MTHKKHKSNIKKLNRRMKKNGYLFDPLHNKPVHWVVFRKRFGTPPTKWHIHHIDWCKTNNACENLLAIPERFHVWIHSKVSHKKYTRDELIDRVPMVCTRLSDSGRECLESQRIDTSCEDKPKTIIRRKKVI